MSDIKAGCWHDEICISIYCFTQLLNFAELLYPCPCVIIVLYSRPSLVPRLFFRKEPGTDCLRMQCDAPPPHLGRCGDKVGICHSQSDLPPHMGHFLQSQTPTLPRIWPTLTADFCEDCDRCPFLCMRSLDKRPTYPHPWRPAHVTITLSFPTIRPRWG